MGIACDVSGCKHNGGNGFCELDKQGRLLKLPCKVGDTLCWFDFSGEYHEDIVNCIYIESGLTGIKIETLCCQINAEEIGKTVFFTREAAEKALLQTGNRLGE